MFTQFLSLVACANTYTPHEVNLPLICAIARTHVHPHATHGQVTSQTFNQHKHTVDFFVKGLWKKFVDPLLLDPAKPNYGFTLVINWVLTQKHDSAKYIDAVYEEADPFANKNIT